MVGFVLVAARGSNDKAVRVSNDAEGGLLGIAHEDVHPVTENTGHGPWLWRARLM